MRSGRSQEGQDDFPGPGSYNEADRTSAPSYSVGGRREMRIEDSPGPGQYESPNSKIQIGYSMSQQRRMFKDQ